MTISIGVAVGVESHGNPQLNRAGVTQTVTRHATGRQHGGQGGPLRPVRLRHVGRRDDRLVERLGQRVPRQLHADRRARAADEHPARRGHAGRASASASPACSCSRSLTVFIAGLMVGRTPEFLGKKIQAAEMKMVVLHILFAPLVILGFAAASVVLKTAVRVDLQPGTARPVGDRLRVRVVGRQQRLGVRRPRRRTPTGTTRRWASRCSSGGSS